MLPTDLKRFEKHIDKQPGDGCWLWTSKSKNFRIGSLKDKTRRTVIAHRLYYEHFNGPVPEGKMLLRECDNRACVRPDHMVIGDIKQHTLLKRKHGTFRTGNHKGGRNPRAKLTDRQAWDIIWLRRGETNSALAKEYGVNHSAIGFIRQGKTFKHLDRPEHDKYATLKTTGDTAILNLMAEGLGCRRIAKRLAMPKSTVSRYMRKFRLQVAKASTT